MCGRYALVRDIAAIAADLTVPVPERLLPPDANIAPGRDIYIERVDDADASVARLETARWGLIPSWAKDPSIGQRMINARCETVGERPAYRRAFARRRCLIPADAFYEWTRSPRGGKQPHLLRPADGSLMVFAGLFERWHDRNSRGEAATAVPGEWLQSATILTTAAVGAPGQVHDRMPVVVAARFRDAWLDPQQPGAAVLASILDEAAQAASAGWWQTYPVSRAVNSGRAHGLDLMQPIDPGAGLIEDDRGGRE